MKYVLAYDVGTTGVKTCLFGIEQSIELIASAGSDYHLYIMENGGAEQDHNEWWEGMCRSTKELFSKTSVKPDQVAGISFCSQMQGLILVDKDGVPVRRPMSYMDQRAVEENKKGIANGIQIAGANIFKLIPSLLITGAVASSVKDPVWRYKWVENHEPELFKKAYKWLDVKDYLICRCTGEFAVTEDSAFGTMIYDNRPGKGTWSKKICRMFGIDMNKLPKIIRSTDIAGQLTSKAATELGLKEGTPVFGGGGDSSLIGVGSGCVHSGDTHVYVGTSGWVITVTDKRMVDVNAMIAAITGAQSGKYNYFAEMEIAGKCMEWVRDHLALDEIGIYAEKKTIEEKDGANIYDFLYDLTLSSVPGAGGVIFTPWLHGNRCPFEDPSSTGMFFGLKLETTKYQLVQAVLEGVFYHLRWMMEAQDNKLRTSDPVRFVGGGAISPAACQLLANILGRKVETVSDPQYVGAAGAAAIIGVGLGAIPNLDCVASFVPTAKTYEPDMKLHAAYQPYYDTFKQIYKTNKKLYKQFR